MKTLHCKRCGNDWSPTVMKSTARCPNCKSMDWEKRKTLHCKRCEHDWTPRVMKPTARCPVCRSMDWRKN